MPLRPTGEEIFEQNNDNDSYNCNRAISEDRRQQNSFTNDVYHFGDRTDCRTNVECPEYIQVDVSESKKKLFCTNV